MHHLHGLNDPLNESLPGMVPQLCRRHAKQTIKYCPVQAGKLFLGEFLRVHAEGDLDHCGDECLQLLDRHLEPSGAVDSAGHDFVRPHLAKVIHVPDEELACTAVREFGRISDEVFCLWRGPKNAVLALREEEVAPLVAKEDSLELLPYGWVEGLRPGQEIDAQAEDRLGEAIDLILVLRIDLGGECLLNEWSQLCLDELMGCLESHLASDDGIYLVLHRIQRFVIDHEYLSLFDHSSCILPLRLCIELGDALVPLQKLDAGISVESVSLHRNVEASRLCHLTLEPTTLVSNIAAITDFQDLSSVFRLVIGLMQPVA